MQRFLKQSFLDLTSNINKKGTRAQVFSCEFFEIFKNTFYRIPLVVASELFRPSFSALTVMLD